MIFGSEEPALFPVKDLYDTGMIQSYINSVQKEYERGIAEQKEFQKNFGDFFSPIAKDMESWNNLTMKPIQNAINFMQQNGIDPFRSSEGRALLSKLVNNVNYGDLARLRQSAKEAEEYVKNRDELKRNGLYSYDMDKWENPISIENWDTLKNGAWTSTSPSQYKTYDQMLKPIIDELQSSPQHLRDEGYYSYFGVSDDRVKDSLNANMEDLLAQPSMQYMLSTLGGDKDKLRQVLTDRIKSKLPEKREVNDVKFKLADLSIKQQQLALDKAKTAADIALTNAKSREAAAKGQGGDGTYNYGYVSFNTAMMHRGFNGGRYVGDDGYVHYMTPAEQEQMDKDNYIQEKLANHVLFDPVTKKNVKLKDLPEKQRLNTIKKLKSNGRIETLYKKYEVEYYKKKNAELVNNYVKNNNAYWSQGSLAMASPDDGEQWKAMFQQSQIKYDDENKTKPIGIKTDSNRMKNQIVDISEVTQRSGAVNKYNAYNKYQNRFNSTRSAIAYVDSTNDGSGQDQIVQYEPRLGRYNKYRRVNAYNEDGDLLGEMWFDCGDPGDMTSTIANGIDSRGAKAAGASTKGIESPLDTTTN